MIDTVERLQGGECETIIVSGTQSDTKAIGESAEFILNLCTAKKWIPTSEAEDVYIPREVSWAQKANWK